MSRSRSKLYRFHGEELTLVEISKLTGIGIWTTRRRASRGIPFDKPLRQTYHTKTKESKLRLTGDIDRDLKAIITARHRDVIRRHMHASRCELCA